MPLGKLPIRATRGTVSLFCLILLTTGCSHRTSVKHVEITGKVSNKGVPLTGGRITFVSVQGGFSGSANIDAKGNYKISAPLGEAKIGVDNSMLAPPKKGGATSKPKNLKRPGSEEPSAIQGKYVSIPYKYADPETSGLKYTVEDKTPQTYDVPLD